MSDDLKEYTVHIHGIPHTVLLSDQDAKERGVFDAADASAGEGDEKATPRKRAAK